MPTAKNIIASFEAQFNNVLCTRAGELVREHYGRTPLAYLHSFGCQENESDTEHIRGLLETLGFAFTNEITRADFVLFNTCAVRESAEDRVFGNVGALKNQKLENPKMMIALCGCMMQQPSVAEKIRKSYPYVDIVFGTNALHALPEMLVERLRSKKRVFWETAAESVVEGIPVHRAEGVKAWLPIMAGCDNFCSYCIVPYVRGREMSRTPEAVIAEAREILSKGYKEITLLGQNVNSYGKGLATPCNFAELVRRLDAIEGEHQFRFMTSHPKDCTHELMDAIAESRHFCHHFHLPVQSGNDRVLRTMNRRYDVAKYRELIGYARSVMPDVSFSSDIIVGFPGETREEFLDTLALIEEVRYNALYTFIYSRRSGTPAAKMEDVATEAEKSQWFRQLLEVQQNICTEQNTAEIGNTLRVLLDGAGKGGAGFVAGRTAGNVIVEAEGDASLIGSFVEVKITRAMNWAMFGTIVADRADKF